MAVIDHSKRELEILGFGEDSPDENRAEIGRSIIKIIESALDDGYLSRIDLIEDLSGIIKKLINQKPLSPLTGKDDEWNLASEKECLYQNKRCSHVFKDRDGAYNINGKIFRTKSGTTYSCKDSSVWIEFPYTVPEPIIIDVDK
jgi:hypothetical protein